MVVEIISENSHQGMQVLAWDNGVSSLKRLDGKVTIITGDARGIGEATVRLFARHDARVVITGIEDAVGQALANSLGPAVAFIHCEGLPCIYLPSQLTCLIIQGKLLALKTRNQYDKLLA